MPCTVVGCHLLCLGSCLARGVVLQLFVQTYHRLLSAFGTSVMKGGMAHLITAHLIMAHLIIAHCGMPHLIIAHCGMPHLIIAHCGMPHLIIAHCGMAHLIVAVAACSCCCHLYW
jgi:hypothetical protein